MLLKTEAEQEGRNREGNANLILESAQKPYLNSLAKLGNEKVIHKNV